MLLFTQNAEFVRPGFELGYKKDGKYFINNHLVSARNEWGSSWRSMAAWCLAVQWQQRDNAAGKQQMPHVQDVVMCMSNTCCGVQNISSIHWHNSCH